MTPSWRRPVDPYLTGGSGQSNKNGHTAWSHWKPSINKATRSSDSPVTPSSSEVSVFGGGSSSVWFVEVQSGDVADGWKKNPNNLRVWCEMIVFEANRRKEPHQIGINDPVPADSYSAPSWTSCWRQPLKVEDFFCCWCLMGTDWPRVSAGMVEARVSWPSVFFISYPSDSVADCSHSSPDSLSAGQMLIVFIIGSYENPRRYPVSIPASRSNGSAIILPPQCLLSPPI